MLQCRAADLGDQLRQLDEILHAQRAPASRHGHEQINVPGIRPPPRQRALHTLLVEEEHAILSPVLTDRDEHELPAAPRMERMRHTNYLLRNRPIKRS